MTSLASREMTEQEMINTCTAPQMAHLIQVLRQTIRNKDKEIERWVDMVRDGELDPPEPKPLLADAQVGDLCQTRGEGYHLISDVYTDQRKYAYERNCGDTIYVRENGMFNLINHEHPFDIIHTEPLATEGTAEWAWQMMLLGKMVSNIKHPDDAMFIEKDIAKYVNSNNIMTYERRFFCATPTDGWQLYEEPQPTYKVGDWVEYKKGKHHQVDSVHDGCCYLSYGKGCGCFSALYSDITRKLDPSEVVIRIGCLSGTVTYAISDDCFLLAKVNDPQHRACCIDMSMLDTPTRELVESLLKAQGEK